MVLFNPVTGRIRGFYTFPKGIYPKVNVIARLEFELAYYDSAVYRFNHYIMRTSPCSWERNFSRNFCIVQCTLTEKIKAEGLAQIFQPSIFTFKEKSFLRDFREILIAVHREIDKNKG